MGTEREEQHRRLTEPHRSKGAKIGWKRHKSSYNRANRKKERDSMNTSFYDIAKQLEETMNESEVIVDDMFTSGCEIAFEHIAGGIGIKVNAETGEISITSTLAEEGHGNYKLETSPMTDTYKQLYEDLKDEFSTLCNTFDKGVQQIIAKHGLRTTG